MATIFSKIVAGEIPCHRVWEDGEHLAFLDIQPWSEGHTLVIPKREEDYLFDLSPERSQALWAAAHHVAQRLKAELNCERVAVLVLGYEVAHAHIHLIPTHSEREVLQAQRHPTDHAALAALAARLRGESLQPDLEADRAADSTPKAPPTTEQVESRWDDFAARFVEQAEQTTMRAARAAMDHLELGSARDVLEIGCGGGGAGVELKRQIDAAASDRSSSAHLTLTDISNEMIQIAQAHMTTALDGRSFDDARVTIERADAQALPYVDARFDRVFSCLNLMLVPNHTAVIRESARVLQPGGRAVWVVWGRPAQSHMMQLTPRALAEVGVSAPPPPRSNFHLGGLDTLKDELRDAGFDVVRRWYQPMMTGIESGEEFTEMTLKLRPELVETLETEDRLARFKLALTRLSDEVLERGEGIGLDALIVVARRATP